MDHSPSLIESTPQLLERADELETMDRLSVARQIDRVFAFLLPIQWVIALVVAVHLSPFAWEGRSSRIHPHVIEAAYLGGFLVSLPTLLAIVKPGAIITRHAIAVGQMLIGSLLIHLSGGRIETHFYVFGSLAFLALYRDRTVLLTATAITGIDHLVRGIYWPLSIFGTNTFTSWRWLENVGWVLYEDLVLLIGGTQVDRKTRESALRQAELEGIRDKIELKVEERTAELKQAYVELEQQAEEKQCAELGRKSAEERSASILEAVVDGIITFDMSGIVESHNPAAARIFGIPRGELTGRGLGSLIPEFDRQDLGCDPSPFLTDQNSDFSLKCRELAGVRVDGTTFPVELSISLFTINDRLMFTGTIRDITDRKIIEEQLASSDRERREIMEAIPDMIFVLDKKGSLVKWNHRVETVTGLAPSVLMGRSAADFFALESKSAITETIRRTFQTGFGEVEVDLLREFGPPIPHQLVTAPLRNEDGEVIGLAGVGRDVTERKRAEEDLRRAHITLEERVFERTAELEWTNQSLMDEVAERRRVEEELRIGEQRLRFQADAMPQIVWTARPDGTADYFNRRWYEYTGIEMESADPSGAPQVIHHDDLERTRRAWTYSIESGADFQSEYRLCDHQTGQFRWHLGRAVALRDDLGAVIQWVGTCTDIDNQKHNEAVLQKAHDDLELRVSERTTELQNANELMQLEVSDRRKAEEEALEARAIAEAATRAKSEFLANMSHEIRTPMNGVIGMTELALETELTSRQREYLEMVRSSADSLLTVINDILDFSKIEADQLDLDPIPFEIHSCLEETLHALALRAHAKGLELACRIGTEVPGILMGDANRLRQIVVNLVGNAIKFTERGEVFMAVGSRPLDEGSVLLTVAVSDTGIGIPLEKQQRIFEPFEQADGSTTRNYGGTGLGLSITSKLVELMGGSMKIDSEVGEGSTFSFTAILGKPLEQNSVRGRFDPSSLENLPVLVVDDNATNRRVLEEILCNWGAIPFTAESAAEALKILRGAALDGKPFPIGLIDVMMPDMDGITLAESIRREPAIAEITLLILTSAGFTEDVARSRALGISCFLTKPVRQAELLRGLIASMPDSQASLGDSEPCPIAIEGPLNLKPKASRALHILVADDHPVNQKMAARMLEAMGHTSAVASDGREAVQRFASENFDMILMDIHMPVMDGFEALAAIRAGNAAGRPRVPIVAVTAHAMKGDRERCLARGFDGYLAKPIRSAELFRTLESHAPSPPSQTDLEWHPEVETIGGGESSRFIDSIMARLVERCGNDVEFAKELLESFLNSAPRSLESIDSAQTAKNCAALAAAAHGLKGACLTLCADDLAKACRDVEETAQRGDFETAGTAVGSIHSQWARFKNALPAMSGVSS